MGAERRGVQPKKGCRITISDIRDREDSKVPRSALKAVVERIAHSMEQLGLKASIETVE